MKIINTQILGSFHAILVIALLTLAFAYAFALIDPWGVAQGEDTNLT